LIRSAILPKWLEACDQRVLATTASDVERNAMGIRKFGVTTFLLIAAAAGSD